MVFNKNLWLLAKAIRLPPLGTSLNDCSWEEIRAISDAGLSNDYFKVGDCKEIVLNGTVGNLSLSNYSTYVYIIGIDHNAEIEGANRIHFQLAKTALSNGRNIALADSKNNTTVSTTGYFSMNGSNSNVGGWESSQMRQNICGTSLTNCSGTILDIIPTELRDVLKPVVKYTDNTGYTGATNEVTATTDYFFLLSEYEVFGEITYSNEYEANKQKQYEYYSAGNSKVKHHHTAITTAIRWWLRSASSSRSSYFTTVYTDGDTSNGTANSSFGFAPAFCV